MCRVSQHWTLCVNCLPAGQSGLPSPFCSGWLWDAQVFHHSQPPRLDVPNECSIWSGMSQFSPVAVTICEVFHSWLTVSEHRVRHCEDGPNPRHTNVPILLCMSLSWQWLLLYGWKDILIFSIIWILDAFSPYASPLCGINRQLAHKCCCTDVTEWNLDCCCWAWTNTPKTKPLFHVWCTRTLKAYRQVKNCIDSWKFCRLIMLLPPLCFSDRLWLIMNHPK